VGVVGGVYPELAEGAEGRFEWRLKKWAWWEEFIPSLPREPRGEIRMAIEKVGVMGGVYPELAEGAGGRFEWRLKK
jgi:hypothetical protein